MGRDFARKGQHKTSRDSGASSYWLWLLAGTLIGMIISAIALFKLFPVIYPKIADLESAKVVAQKPAEPVKEAQKRTPQFDFYSLLPELEVVVPEQTPSAEAIAIAPTDVDEAQTPHENAHEKSYRLQLGSFKKFEDADRLKAQMALSGIQVEIEAVTLGNNENWFRVRSAPYTDRASAESIKSQLQAQSIQSLLVEDKG
ncbi:MAG: SPOR domain-containing protein [Gammaproteobacteria bacterium]|jgi:cell division protein FtsN